VIAEDRRRHLNSELDLVWPLFTALAVARRACLGKHLLGRLVLTAPAVLADRYAPTGRTGRQGDFAGMPPTAQRVIASAMLDGGPRTASELRLLAGIGSIREVKRALELEPALVEVRWLSRHASWSSAMALAQSFTLHMSSPSSA
jgi:hypothetical protein